MSSKECKECKVEKEYTEFYVMNDGRHMPKCRECVCKIEREKRHAKNPNTIPRPRKRFLVRGHWLGAVITLSDRKLETRKVTEADIPQLKAEGFGFILKSGI